MIRIDIIIYIIRVVQPLEGLCICLYSLQKKKVFNCVHEWNGANLKKGKRDGLSHKKKRE